MVNYNLFVFFTAMKMQSLIEFGVTTLILGGHVMSSVTSLT